MTMSIIACWSARQSRRFAWLAGLIVAGIMFCASTAQAQTLNTPVDFSNDVTGLPDTEDWITGVGPGAGAQADQGPNGVGDHALLYSANAGAGFHPQTFNNTTILGDPNVGAFTAAGVTDLQFDARHTGDFEDVVLRVYLFAGPFFNAGVPTGNPHGVSAVPLTIATTDTNWTTYTMSLRPFDLIPIAGNVVDLLNGVTQIGLRHDPNGDGAGNSDPFALGNDVYFDNITLLGNVAGPPGDFDGDGDVDDDDLAQWEGDFGLNGDSDADGDGDSDGRDFLTWQQNHTGPIPPIAAVPEPSTWALLALGILSLRAWPRKRHLH